MISRFDADSATICDCGHAAIARSIVISPLSADQCLYLKPGMRCMHLQRVAASAPLPVMALFVGNISSK